MAGKKSSIKQNKIIFQGHLKERVCSVIGCKNKHYGKGLCVKHYCEVNSEHRKRYYQINKKHIAEIGKQYRLEKKEHYDEYNKQYYKKNKARLNKNSKQYHLLHKEHLNKCQRIWYLNNPEYSSQYWKKNKEHRNKYERQWLQTPTGKASNKARCSKHRALTRGLTIAIVQSVYEDNIKKYGRLTCCLCFKPIEFGKDSLEHLTPLLRGGSNNFNNLGVAHQSCNSKKRIKTLEEWFANKK